MPKKLRLGFRKEHDGREHVALCPNEYKTILNMAGRKLQISNKALKQARLVVNGETLSPENASNLLNDGCVVVVHLQSGKANKQPGAQEVDFSNDLPPLAPRLYSQQHQTQEEVEPSTKSALETTSSALRAPAMLLDEPDTTSTVTATLSSLCFDGPYPVLEGNVLSLVRESVASCKSFTETDFGDYVAFDYKDASFSEVFPNPRQFRKHRQRWLMALRRECRGLLLCKTSGKVLRRPFHKFFNLHEMPESSPDNIPVTSTEDMLLLEKVDGSLVSPLLLKNEIVWASRKSLQPTLQAYCSISHNQDMGYERLARFCILEHNATPLFEWCQAGHAVGVVLHNTTSVTLLAIRDMTSGQYYSHEKVKEIAEKFTVPCVNPLPVSTSGNTIQEIAKEIAARPAPLEGGVLIVGGGQHFYKIKTLWYVSMASAAKRASLPWSFLQEFLQKRPSLAGVPSDRIWKAALWDQAADDSRALCKSLLVKEQGDELERFCHLCDAHVQTLHVDLSAWSARLRDRASNAEKSCNVSSLATKFVEESGWSEKLLRAYIQDPELSPSNLRQELFEQSRADLEFMFGVYWDSQIACVKVDETKQKTVAGNAEESPSLEEEAKDPEEDGRRYIFKSQLFPPDSLETPPKGITDHVCSTYLPRKIANYLGKSKGAIVDETRIEIDRDYVGSEGKLKGTNFPKKKIADLRIDLQPPEKELSKHNGNREWALWLVQYGPNENTKKSSKQKAEGWKSGHFAGVFVETNCSFRYRDIRKALQCSFDQRRLVFLGSDDAVTRVPQAERENSNETVETASTNHTMFGELCFSENLVPEISINPSLPEPESMESNETILRNLILFGKLPPGVKGPVVIVMRGLPGSGKSSWTKALQRKCDGHVTVVSADSYFQNDEGYQFNANQRGAAHDHCRSLFMGALQDTTPHHQAIIVDNTNSTRKEYQFYVNQANKAKRRSLTVEMMCRSNDELMKFFERGLHGVPIRDMGRMFGRWESNEEAFLFQTATESSETTKGPRLSPKS